MHSSETDEQHLLAFGNVDEDKEASVDVGLVHCHPSDSNNALPFAITFIVGMGSLLFGYNVGFSSPSEDSIRKVVFNGNENRMNWAWSLLNVGAMIGGLICGPIAWNIGLKKTVLLNFFPFIIGIFLMYTGVATDFVFGRIMVGVGVGYASVIVPLYITEVTPAHLRGTLGCCHQLLISFGILLATIVGLPCMNNDTWWKVMLIIALAFVVIQFVGTLIYGVESPRWLLQQNRVSEAQNALLALRGSKWPIEKEINETLHHIEMTTHSHTQHRVPLWDAVQEPHIRKPFVIGVGLMIIQQWSGINAVMFHMKDIFESGTSHSAASLYGSIAVNAIQVVSVLIASLMIEQVGRRLFLIISSAGMGVCAFAMAIASYSDASLPFKVLAMMGYIVAFSLGIGPLPWVVGSEIFPFSVRSIAMSVCTVVNWTCSFLVTLLFRYMSDTMTTSGLFFFYGIVCFGSVALVFLLMPETRGKTLEEIEDFFKA